MFQAIDAVRPVANCEICPASAARAGALAALWVFAAAAVPLLGASEPWNESNAPIVRLALSEKMLSGINPNEARAALAVWRSELSKATGVRLVVDNDPVMTSEQLLPAIRSGRVDLFSLTVQEYWQVARYVDTTWIITDSYAGDELLLVVRQGWGISGLADLRGKSVILLDSPHSTLAEVWLAEVLWRERLQPPERFFGRIERNTKLPQVVLPLFFGHADACVVTRRGLNTMLELNPQLSRKLRILTVSPRLEGIFFGWRQNFPAPVKRTFLDRVATLISQAWTAQLLTLFQTPGLTARNGECLRPAISLLETYERHRELPAERSR